MDEQYVRSVCRVGQEDACAYAVKREGGGYSCTKGTSVGFAIEGRLETGPNRKGDNCGGYPKKGMRDK